MNTREPAGGMVSGKKVNGFMLREALKRWENQRSLASSMFNDSIYVFENEAKTGPLALMEQFQQADRNYARLQELQQTYNNNIKVTVGGETITLSLAVKLVGGAGRIEKMWRQTVLPKTDRYSYNERQTTRSKDTEYAQRAITQDECLKMATQASKYATQLRSAIAAANSTDYSLSITDAEYNTLFGE